MRASVRACAHVCVWVHMHVCVWCTQYLCVVCRPATPALCLRGGKGLEASKDVGTGEHVDAAITASHYEPLSLSCSSPARV